MTNVNISNRKIRVFISSTFVDMNGERNYLTNKIFPRIKEFCQKRKIEFLPLDLRWGITEEEQKEGRVVDMCLSEVDNARPFFIGLLGERYGWAPNKDDLGKFSSELFNRYDWLPDYIAQGKSITEMEMQYAALMNNNIKHASFYIRGVGIPTPDEYCEQVGSDTYNKLQQLKKKITEQETYAHYTYNSLEELGERIFEDVKKMVEEEFEILDSQRQSNHIYQFQVASTASTYVEIPSLLAKVNNWHKGESRVLIINGEKGVGKSSLARWWVHTQLAASPGAKIIYHDYSLSDNNLDYFEALVSHLNDDIGFLFGWSKSTAAEAAGCLWGFFKLFFGIISSAGLTDNPKELGLKLGADFNFQLSGFKESGRLRKKLRKCKNQELVIIIDNIELEEEISTVLRYFNEYPTNVRFIFTARIKSIAQKSIMAIFKSEIITIDNISIEDSQIITERYLDKYRKKLSEEQLSSLLSGFFATRPKLLKLVLDQLVAFGSFEELSSKINEYVAAKSELELITHSISNMLEDFEVRGKTNYAKYVLVAISNSHMGLSETEIQNIFELKPLEWSMVRSRILSLCNYSNEKYYLSDDLYREVVSDLCGSVFMAEVLSKLITYFESLLDYKNRSSHIYKLVSFPDYNKLIADNKLNMRQAEELPNLYIKIGDFKSLFSFVSYVFNDKSFSKRDRQSYWDLLYSNGYAISDIKVYNGSNLKADNDEIEFYASNLMIVATTLQKPKDIEWIQAKFLNDNPENISEITALMSLYYQRQYHKVIQTGTTTQYSSPLNVVMSMMYVSMAYEQLGDYANAIKIAWQGLEKAKSSRLSKQSEVYAIINYCSICSMSGNKDLVNDAERRLAECYDYQMGQGLDGDFTWRMLSALGHISIFNQKFSNAIGYFEKSATALRLTKLENAPIMVITIYNQGYAMYMSKDYVSANVKFDESIALSRRIFKGDTTDIAYSLYYKSLSLFKNYKESEALSTLKLLDMLLSKNKQFEPKLHELVISGIKQMEQN